MRTHIETAPPRTAIYARQSADEDQGIAQQLEDCRAEVRRRGWLLAAEFQDNDTSASRERGPKTAWSAMLRSFDAGEIDAILVTETSRITRSLIDVLDLRPPRRDVRVVVIREGIDTDTDDFMLKQLVLLAEREVKIKSERAARYAVSRRLAGHPAAGKPPHGYRWIPSGDRPPSGTRYRIDDREADDVLYIFREFLAGGALGQIARDLSDSGRLTRQGARWQSSTVRRVLLNPIYAALLPPAQPSGQFDTAAIDLDACAPGAWEAIVDRDQLVATRSRLIGVTPTHNGTARRWLLSGLAICAVCSTPVRSARGETHPTARLNGGGGAPSARYHAYRCPAGHFMRNGDILDEYVSELCIARLSTDDIIGLIAPNEADDIALLYARQESLKGRRQSIAKFVAQGLITDTEAAEGLRVIAAELQDVGGQISQAVKIDPLADLVHAEDARAWWDGASLARRRSVIGLLMTVRISPVGRGRRITSLSAAADSVTVDWH